MHHFLLAAGCAAIALGAVGCSQGPGDPEPSIVAEQIRKGLGSGEAAGPVAAGPKETWTEDLGRANFRGKITVQGTVALAAKIASKDQAVCAPGGKQPPNEEFVVDSASGGVKDVVVFFEGIEDEWCDEAAKPGKSEQVVFDQKACIFLTHVMASQVSQPILIKNSDPVDHNTKLDPKANTAINPIVGPGNTVLYEPTDEESAPFSAACTIHPWMSAWIITRKNGYFYTTGANGEFTIPNLPAGVTLKCKIWQEKAKFLKAGVLAKPVEGAKWAGSTLEIKLAKGADLNLELVIDASKLPK